MKYECKNCNKQMQDIDDICYNCGLICNEKQYSSYSFEENNYQSCIGKNKDWLLWNNDEKTQYKLSLYIKDLCNQINTKYNVILNNNIQEVIQFVTNVMNAIKSDFNGPKRSRVKDGIIVMCIHYILKQSYSIITYVHISKLLNLNTKYISKANKFILELINNGKLQLSIELKNCIYSLEKPLDYVNKIITKHNLNISSLIITNVSKLINICEDNDILLDHTPLSIGVSCFYYILKDNNMDIDIKIFSELYNISTITIFKTYNKLLLHKEILSKKLLLN